MKPRRHGGLAAVALGLVALLWLAARAGGLGQGVPDLERWILDQRFAWRGPRPATDQLVLVVLDDETLARHPLLFEKRAEWARLIRALAAAGPSVIGVDAMFLDPERPLPAGLITDIEALLADPALDRASPAARLLERVAAETRGDATLAAAVVEAGNVVLGIHVDIDPRPAGDDAILRRGRYGQAVLGARPPLTGASVQASLPSIGQGAAALGYVTLEEDPDKTVRGLRLARRAGGGVYLPLSLAMVARHLGLERGQLAYLGSEHRAALGARQLALDVGDRLLLDFAGPARSLPTYSAADVLDGRVPAAALAGRMVLVGYSYLGHDTIRTPYGRVEPALSVHAAAIDNLLAGGGLREVGVPLEFGLALVLGALVALGFAWRPRFTPLPQLLVALALLGIYLGLGQLAFARLGLWVGASGAAALVLAASAVGLVQLYLTEGRQKLQLRRTFAHYLSDQVIAQLVADPSRLRLGGERRELTVLFSDVRNFTSLSEQLAPEALVQMLNRYLTPMTRAVLAERGFLDKYIGDAIMAVFGAPLADPAHADRALSCALRFYAELPRVQAALGVPGVTLDIGVGVNSGPMVVGNLGSDERFDYTVVGDPVNVASRLEGLCKVYGVRCVVGEATRAAASPRFDFRALDLVRVKGREAPLAIFELLGDATTRLASYPLLELHEAAVEAYRRGELGTAREAFARFAAANPQDPVARLYLARLDALPAQVPSVWDPATTLTTK